MGAKTRVRGPRVVVKKKMFNNVNVSIKSNEASEDNNFAAVSIQSTLATKDRVLDYNLRG